MQKLLSALLVLLSFWYFNAQTVQLSWQGTQVENYGAYKKTFPKFTNGGFSTDGANVYFKVNAKSNEQRFKVTNLNWKKVNDSELFDIDASELPDRANTGINYHYKIKEQQEFYSLIISTFKKNGNEIYRLESFDIVPEAASATAKMAATNPSAKLGTNTNPLKSGTFYKIKIDKSGIFKITKKFLQENGINVSNINPKNFRIYGNGGVMLPEFNRDDRYDGLQENAIQVVGEADGKWDDGDYALFYAQGPHGFNLYEGNYNYGNSRTETRNDNALHLQNIYEDYSYYFINFDKGPGKRVENLDSNLPQSLITRYDDFQFLDQDKTNILQVGRLWVGDEITTEKTVSFKTKSPIRAEDEIYYRLSVVAYKAQNNNIKFDINGKNTITSTISNGTNLEKNTNFRGTVSGITGNSLDIHIMPSTSANPNGQFYFDYAEVLYKEDLKYNGEQFNFRDYSIFENNLNEYGFSVANASAAEQVWDVSDITNAKSMMNKSGTKEVFSFGYHPTSANFNNEFVIFKNTDAYEPTFVGKIENQNIAGLQNIDYLIITRQDMLQDADRLSKFHQNKEKFNTAVVTIDKIYNEFSSGSQDITAIRDFVTYLKKEAGGLKYVLLLGDASYDYKNKTSGNDNVVPAYESEYSSDFEASFVTDDYYVVTEPQKSVKIDYTLPDVPIGRLPASNTSEAKLLVDKALAYNNALAGQSSPFGEWRMKLDFVVDDDNDFGAPFHFDMENALKSNFESGERQEYNVRKLYLDAFPQVPSAGGLRYPAVNQAIASDMNNSLYMFYFGHGGINGWAQERVLSLEEINNFNNFSSAYSRFPFVSTITCEFTLWDVPSVNSAGEMVIKHKNGGAATMITSSRAVSVLYGREFTDAFTTNIFELVNGDFKTLGEAFLEAKKEYGIDTNHFKVNFLGDPAMKLSRPKRDIVIEKIETPVQDKIRALDFVKITGFITNGSGTIDTSYNGRVAVNVFDKRIDKKTLNNDGNLLPIMKYTEEGSAIVKSAGKAVNGKFTAEFYVPKDINYTEGQGRLLLYADNFANAKANARDVFTSQPITVGDINPDGIKDNQAPKINLFMNNTNFADGGITNENPMLLACLTDDTGINSTGAGIGHDITVVLDGQVINTTVLNDYFKGGEGNGCINTNLAEYQKGSVTYPFKNLTPGQHQLVFKVWDINNNSSTATLNFIVKKEQDQKLVINRLLNWPNPFTDKTYIQFEHNCDDILDVNVQIYTITGRLVRTISQSVAAEPFLQGYRTPRQAIEWDGKDDYGATVGKGTYIYKVFVKGQNQDKCKGNATSVEKAVLLK